MPFANTTTGRSYAINERPRPLYWHLKRRIEVAADVTITLVEDEEEFGRGWNGRANRDIGGAVVRSEIVANVFADGPTLALDALAVALGVTVTEELADVA